MQEHLLWPKNSKVVFYKEIPWDIFSGPKASQNGSISFLWQVWQRRGLGGRGNRLRPRLSFLGGPEGLRAHTSSLCATRPGSYKLLCPLGPRVLRPLGGLRACRGWSFASKQLSKLSKSKLTKGPSLTLPRPLAWSAAGDPDGVVHPKFV